MRAEAGSEMTGVRQLIPGDIFLTFQPPEMFRFHQDVCSEGTARKLTTTRAVTVLKNTKIIAYFVTHLFTQAATFC